jgi:hypothetical protein
MREAEKRNAIGTMIRSHNEVWSSQPSGGMRGGPYRYVDFGLREATRKEAEQPSPNGVKCFSEKHKTPR